MPAVPVATDDPVNARVLAVGEDRLPGFRADPFGDLARAAELDVETVLERVRAMLDAGVVRRVRQTLLANKLADGALVAWWVPEDKLSGAFDQLFRDDPFAGHVVVRSTDRATPGSGYRLWTTLKVPQGYSLQKHADWWAARVGATATKLMSAKCLFVLGVGHVRRRTIEPGTRAEQAAEPISTQPVMLSDEEWRVVAALKRELSLDEVRRDVWAARADEAGVPLDRFLAVAKQLDARGLVGRFSTFLEHVKKLSTGERVTKFNALFHWRVPAGLELKAGGEVGRHACMTHAYWREGGPAFADVNVMGVAHGQAKDAVLAHKAAIDAHLEEAGVPVLYTNVFWGGRSEIKPSEILPSAYAAWCRSVGVDPDAMRA